ncbi:hypothetical protein H9Q13_01075 [Pontibacter sp. JH31]|uniref:Nucleoside-specific outer membrane channel protein Tsx n=1 Tax=Pontibacter aquaedesilientis TaxID=2766980 RepID=A0ABR7XBR5_9BACT|nr:hypothetical protein [Pontibacter aquaedesilientis]MBD1395744.1 hypothetical protein [Pontibacter aquaedesilientis]
MLPDNRWPVQYFGKRFCTLLWLVAFSMLVSFRAEAQVIYKGGSNVQLLYGRNLNQSGQLATITLEHFGDVGAFEHFGFADLFNDASLAAPNLYLEWYPKLSLSRATKSEVSLGPISDVLVGGGINVLFGGTEDFFAYTAGPAFKFRIPGQGLLQLETYYYKQHGAEYHGTYQITPSWDIPIPIAARARFRFRGFMDFIGDRGPGTTQYLTQPQLFVDMGNFWEKPGKVYVGSEWRYWHNVVGIAGLNESILQANVLFTL